MATKFSQLPAADDPTGNEIAAIVQDGQSKKITLNQIATLVGGITWGGFISSAPSFPILSDTQYVSTANFTSGGIDVYIGSVLFAPEGAASMSDLIIKP
jgi:hypothetical protein